MALSFYIRVFWAWLLIIALAKLAISAVIVVWRRWKGSGPLRPKWPFLFEVALETARTTHLPKYKNYDIQKLADTYRHKLEAAAPPYRWWKTSIYKFQIEHIPAEWLLPISLHPPYQSKRVPHICAQSEPALNHMDPFSIPSKMDYPSSSSSSSVNSSLNPSVATSPAMRLRKVQQTVSLSQLIHKDRLPFNVHQQRANSSPHLNKSSPKFPSPLSLSSSSPVGDDDAPDYLPALEDDKSEPPSDSEIPASMSASGSPFESPSSSSSSTPQLNPAKAPFDVEAYHGPVVLYLHGGGYCIGSKRTHRRMVGYISELSDAPVLSINYRLAPEHKFPAGLEDAVQTFQWMLSEGIPAEKIIIMGDSAGGGLTLACMLYLRDHGMPLPGGAVCISPWVDLHVSMESWQKYTGFDYLGTAEQVGRFARAYVQNEADLSHPWVSPLYANLTGLPPILIQGGEIEVLVDEIKALSDKAMKEGVSVKFEMYEDMVHVFQLFGRFHPVAIKAITQIGEFIRTYDQIQGSTLSVFGSDGTLHKHQQIDTESSSSSGERLAAGQEEVVNGPKSVVSHFLAGIVH